ncbi:heterokaryon incompatibility protein-domain-containing protein [Podospora aff. communis PSN243]|uniref:Heterokaryon incompatibility protein-domain-containing protein n=1 Tax=Podospora aff. communis PSN243 TaxID=3040156 RepID=A0AAV9GSF0_9PEZI|nr:heterokaryon incompatibility protein-domain-containing protein [Podospora aff. communis PSN243]
MRLLNVDSRLLHAFYDDAISPYAIPPYAILSHTWDQNEPEVLFEDMKRPDHVQMTRYDKIEHTCRLAIEEGLEWAWIDTCCIDKSSSAELSEAINSMFRRYENSAVCFAHLEDIDKDEVAADTDAAFKKCRWFSRGWTLQELLAPEKVVFYDKAWKVIGDKATLRLPIQHRTAISEIYLTHPRVDFRRAQEDLAYCLLGLFDVNMSLLYGEGDSAFRRLQEEIIKISHDDSLLAWSDVEVIPSYGDLRPVELEAKDLRTTPFAPAPRAFGCLKDKTMFSFWEPRGTWQLATNNFQLELPIYRPKGTRICLALLDCVLEGNINDMVLAIVLSPSPGLNNEFARTDTSLCTVAWEYVVEARLETIRMTDQRAYQTQELPFGTCWLRSGSVLLRVTAGLEERFQRPLLSPSTAGSVWPSMSKGDSQTMSYSSKDEMSDSSLEDILLQHPESTIPEHASPPKIQRTLKYQDACLFGSYLHLIEVEYINPGTVNLPDTPPSSPIEFLALYFGDSNAYAWVIAETAMAYWLLPLILVLNKWKTFARDAHHITEGFTWRSRMKWIWTHRAQLWVWAAHGRHFIHRPRSRRKFGHSRLPNATPDIEFWNRAFRWCPEIEFRFPVAKRSSSTF